MSEALGAFLIILLTFVPTLVAFVLIGGSVLIGMPVSFEKIGWLLTNAQIGFLALGCVAILLSRKSEQTMPLWRVQTNKWIGRVMAVSALFYLAAFLFVGYYDL
ncbi:MAG: hypothetical protein LBU53_07800 [Zoogloeaceae bacterium]|jgi:hypothetical protein|nr:hypothetical protein [Zoogloeaceae bacterium]